MGGDALVSVVGFRFADVRVLGVPAPVPRSFAHWNFRTYIHSTGDWGVVFLKEFVPSRLLAGLVRGLYREPYHVGALTTVAEDKGERRHVGYALRVDGLTHTIAATAEREACDVAPGEAAAFHCGSGWGCSATAARRFRVEHAPWRAHQVVSHSVSVDFEALYGDRWGWLNGQEPAHVLLLDGSEVAVGPPERCR